MKKNLLSLSLIAIMFLAFSCDNPKTTQQKLDEVAAIEFSRDTVFNNYVEYRTGNFPLIITVPHGGQMLDSTLEVRTRENCPDPKFFTGYDTWTPELSEAVDSVVFARTGMYPHIVAMKLKRTYIDVNRTLENAIVTGCKETEAYYKEFFDQVNAAKKSITDVYGSGLLLDFHSHGHKKQEIELGYQITKDQMNMSDEELNSSDLMKNAGIYNLMKVNKQGQTFAQHLRGEYSFGTLLHKNGTPCIPHSENPQPLETKYFSGANVTKSSGSCSGGTIDAIQLEFHRESRNTPEARKETVENLITTVEQYLDLHYNFK